MLNLYQIKNKNMFFLFYLQCHRLSISILTESNGGQNKEKGNKKNKAWWVKLHILQYHVRHQILSWNHLGGFG